MFMVQGHAAHVFIACVAWDSFQVFHELEAAVRLLIFAKTICLID